MIALEAVEKRYRKGFQLGPLDASIDSGVTYLIGENGSGKTTLLRLIAGDLRPDSGAIHIGSGNRESARIGYLAQAPLLPKRASIADYLTYAAWFHGVARSRRETAVESAMRATGLDGRGTNRIGKLSGGTQRRVAIAAALVHQPAVLILDEPSSGLDPAQRIALREVISNIAGDRVVLISTHLVEDIAAHRFPLLVMRSGQLVFAGSSSEIPGVEPDSGSSAFEIGLADLLRSDGDA